MKIAMVSPYDLAWPGGVNSHVTQLSGELRNRGHDVTVIAPHSPAKPAVVQLSDQRFIPMGRSVPLSAAGSKARVTLDWWLYPRIRGLMDRERFDIVHLHEPLAPLLPLMVLQHSKTVNVGTFHAYSHRAHLYRMTRRAVGRWQRRLHGRIAVSPAARDFVSPHFPGYPYRVIPNGIDFQRFADAEPFPELRDGRANILFVGRKDERKGLNFLLRAFPVLCTALENPRLIIVGPGEPDRACSGLLDAITARSPDAVTVTGPVSSADLPRYYASADVFCSPATGGESFGIVLLEAMAAGAPVVASEIAGYRNVVSHDANGLLVPPRDTTAIVDAVVRILKDRSLAERLTLSGRHTAEQYRWERVASQVEDYYRQCIEEVGHFGGSK
jgi:phosphatidylinositol alpha-mannosyltransferase